MEKGNVKMNNVGSPDSYEDRGLIPEPARTRTPKFIYYATVLSAIGGFLFGYDTGVVSGAMIFLRNTFELSYLWQELIVSVTIGAAWAFSMVAGYLTDQMGRKPVILIASFIFTAGSVMLGFANSKWLLLGGRIVVGVGIGLASMTVPVYIAEVAPAEMRGQLVTINNIFITGGQFVASIVDGAFSYDKVHGWRYMLGLAGVPSAIQFFCFLKMPESPRWLVSKGCYQEAIGVLRKIRGTTANIEEEFENMKTSCLEAEREHQEQGGGLALCQVLKTPPIRLAFIVGCALMLFQQIAGINTVMYYSATIIEMSGVHDESKAVWLACVPAAVNFLCTFIGLLVVEKIGRRTLTLCSLGGVVLSLALLAGGFQLANTHTPDVGFRYDADNSSCSAYSGCAPCVNDKNCGFCFYEDESHPPNGTCLQVAKDNTGMSHVGPCNHTDTFDNYIWAYEWCPSSHSWIIMLGLVAYLFFFAPGMGPMPWTINSEIYPLWARSTCFSVATSIGWMFNLLVSMTFLTLTDALTKYGCFYLYTCLAAVGWIFFFFLLPETKGKNLEDVESLFAHPWWRDSTTADDKKTVQTQGKEPNRGEVPLHSVHM